MKKSLLGCEQITFQFEKLAEAIDFEALIKWILVKPKLYFQADLVRVCRIY